MSRITTSQEAQRDLFKLSVYFGEISERLADRFMACVETTFDLLASFPSLGSACEDDHPALVGLRLCSIKRFRSYLILYRRLDDGIEVVRVLHGGRDIESLFEG